MAFLQNGVWVKDRKGRDNVFVAFYPEKGSFNFTALKKGHTLCVLFAMEHIFRDKKVGLRIEDLDEVKVIPCGLDDVFDLGRQYFENKDSCWGCGYNPTLPSSAKASDGPIQDGRPTPTVKLLKCTRCTTALYCNKDCQTRDWKARHRVWCKAIPTFLEVAAINYATYGKDSHF